MQAAITQALGVFMQTTSKASRWTKGRALLAGGLVLGLGAAATLAAWTDDEWVFGGSGSGNGDGPGTPGTGIYQMQQNTWTGTGKTEAWSDQPNKNGGALTFVLQPERMVPGKTVYAPMQLRTVPGSEALNVSLAEGVQAAADANKDAAFNARYNSPELYAALRYGVYKGVAKDNCTAGSVAGGTVVVPPGSPLTATSTGTFPLAAGEQGQPGTPENLCFALTLPSSVTDVQLQGKNTVPVWRFTSSVGS